MSARHVGLGPGSVNKDEALWIQIQLSVEPTLPLAQNIGALLFRGVERLFLRVIPCRLKNRRIVPNPIE